ncbi:MAG: aminoglycoside phosphotransferase family protein [Phycisphaeraceae bacterium]|nr:MAG: aminoglycoside phosphotransferase family protein [Phycisphaeraceae bacterium]
MQPPHDPMTIDPHDLALTAEPEIREACGGRLGPVEWFRSAWQSSGSATGFASWSADPGPGPAGAMIKIPVSEGELRWTRDIAGVDDDPPVPRVLGHGETAAGKPVRWLVVERLAGKPLSAGLDERGATDLIATTFAFHAAAAKVRPVDEAPKPVDWADAVHRAREAVKTHGMPEPGRWAEALRHIEKAAGHLAARWEARPINTWCHGDLHPGNALRRGGHTGRCVLVDLDLVHAGHWIEDAVYFERQYWGHMDLLGGVKPVSALARLRREAGYLDDGNYADLANVRRVLMAALVPLFFDREHNAKYVRAAVETIERTLPQIK